MEVQCDRRYCDTWQAEIGDQDDRIVHFSAPTAGIASRSSPYLEQTISMLWRWQGMKGQMTGHEEGVALTVLDAST